MPDNLWTDLLKVSPLVAVMAFALWRLWVRQEKMDIAHSLALAAATSKCEDRERDLTQRIRIVEDRQHDEAQRVMAACAEALRTNAQTFARMTDRV